MCKCAILLFIFYEISKWILWKCYDLAQCIYIFKLTIIYNQKWLLKEIIEGFYTLVPLLSSKLFLLNLY